MIKTEVDSVEQNNRVSNTLNNSLVFDDYERYQNTLISGKTFNRISSSYRDKKNQDVTKNKAYKVFLDRQV